MASYYVSSVLGSDAFDGSTWVLAKATVAGGLAVATGDNDIVFVDSAHSESVATLTWVAATSGIHVSIISVDRNGSVTTGHSGWLAGATCTINTNAILANISSSGSQHFYIYGISILTNAGNSANNSFRISGSGSSLNSLIAEKCVFNCRATSVSANAIIGPSSLGTSTSFWPIVKFIDCTFTLRNAAGSSAAILFGMLNCEIINPVINFSGGSKPTTLFGFSGSNQTTGTIIIEGDISGFDTASSSLLTISLCAGAKIIWRNVKYSSVPSLLAGSWSTSAVQWYLLNCDSGDTKESFRYYDRLGTIAQSSSVYAISGSTFDSTGISWQVTTTAQCREMEPFVTPWVQRWFTGTSPTVASIEIAYDNVTGLTNRTCWGEFEYVSGSSFPIGAVFSTRNSMPFDASGILFPQSTANWTGTGSFINANSHTVSGTFTPGEKSVCKARLSFGVSGTRIFYLDPFLKIAPS